MTAPPVIAQSKQLSAASRLEERLAFPMFLVTLVFIVLISIMLRLAEKGEITTEQWTLFLLVYLPLWTLFILESFMLFRLQRRVIPEEERNSISGLVWCLLIPPLRIGRLSLFVSQTIVLPFLGRVDVDEALRSRVAKAFHWPMLLITLLVLPVLAGETIWQEEVLAKPWLMDALDGTLVFIWAAFVVEFILFAGLAASRSRYVLTHPIDLFIILLPFAAFLRGARLLRLTRFARFYRGLLFLKFFNKWETEARLIDRIIGLSVTVLIVVVVVWFALSYTRKEVQIVENRYFYTTLEKTSNIGKDTPVQLAGIRIGRVTGVQLQSDGSIRADLEVFRQYHSFLTQGGYFQADNLFGLAAAMGKAGLHFVPGPKGAQPIPENSFIQMVKAKSLEQIIQEFGLDVMTGQVDDIVSRTERITGHVGEISHRLQGDQAAVFAALRHVNKITGDISTVTGEMPALLSRFGESVNTLNQTITLINDILLKQRQAIGATAHDAHAATSGLNQSLEYLDQVLKRLTAVMATIESHSTEFPQILQDGSNAIKNAEEVSRKMKDAPWLGKGAQPVDAPDIPPVHSIRPVVTP